jgi:hypothetical protein
MWLIIAISAIAVIVALLFGFLYGRGKLFSREPVGTLWVDGADIFLEIENLEKLNEAAVIMRVKRPKPPHK